MNCRIARRIGVDPEVCLSAAERAALEDHVRACADCASLQQRDALVSQWLQDLPTAQPSANFEWRLRLRLSQLEHEPPLPEAVAVAPGRRRWVLPFALSSAAAAAAVMAVGLGLGMRQQAAPGIPVATQTASTQVDPSPWTPRPNGQGGLSWPRLVPVRAGAPLGPEVRADAAPSIFGGAPADTSLRQQRRVEPVEVQPVGW